MRAAIIAAIVVAPSLAHAQARSVRVEVVEVAGGRAYLAPGASAGLVAGTTVTIAGKSYRVLDATDGNAAIDIGTDAIAIGAVGSATVEPGAAAHAIAKMAAPHALADFKGQWRDAVHPADTQEVKPVALGSGKAHGRSRIVVTGAGMLFAPLEAPVVASAQVGARTTIEPYADKPFAIDADAAAQVFYTHGGDDAARPNLIVREARLRWGDYADPRFAAGRLRWAASSVGLLDGARLAHAIGGGFELAAFGGVVPDPMSGKPTLDASRFGAELAFDRPRDAWSPRVSVVALGSTWKGALDERRLDALADAAHGPWAVAGYAELSSFAADNPWGAHALELTSAGGGGGWHAGALHLQLDVSYRRPEQSLRLAAYLPPEWLATAPRSQATASASIDGAWGSIDAGATAIRTSGATTTLESSGFGDVRVRLGSARLDLGASGGHTSFLDWIGARAGLGLASRRTSVTIYYRPSLYDYNASTSTFVEERAGVELGYAPRPDVAYDFLVEGQAGNDLDALTAILTVVWRPR